MVEFLFKYSPTVFAKGDFVLLGSWSPWLLAAIIAGGVAGLGWAIRRSVRGETLAARGWRPWAIWLLQAALFSLVLALLWQPAIRISTLKPQQNIIAVLVDNSRSMAIVEDGSTRLQRATAALKGGLQADLSRKFQVRLYRMGEALERIEKPEELVANGRATRIGEALRQVTAEASGLPIGAVVLLSDGGDNSGGIDLETISEIRARRIPVHTVGYGREQAARDIEVTDVQMPARALADSRLQAQVSFRHRGFSRQKAKLTLREGAKVLASREITLGPEGAQQMEALPFNAGLAGARTLHVSVDPVAGEENAQNNQVARLVNVEPGKPRVLYVEGEPRWEFKFIRRAVEDDRSIHLTTMLRTTQNKVYRQGIGNPKELEEGFPGGFEELFAYQGLVIGSVEASYFTPGQQELIRQFVDRRGGGVLFLAGRSALAEGGVGKSPLAELLPVSLPDRKGSFHRERVSVELTGAGRDSLLCRLVEDPARNAERWKKLPPVADYQEIGSPKPGAVVLAEALPGGRTRLPLLVTQNYGRGRVGVLATGGSWRWQMVQALDDKTHEMFWQQMLRWLVTGAPGAVHGTTPRLVMFDDGRLRLAADVREKNYQPMADARVEARIVGPEGISAVVEMTPDALVQGRFEGEWMAEKPGSYAVEILARRGEQEVGRDVLTFQRQDGVAENFRTEQNRELLEKLASQTGGRYWNPGELGRLSREISYSEAGITVQETRDLWNMPAVFLLAVLLRAAEWLLRRRWGAV